jgi:hypothetical protein
MAIQLDFLLRRMRTVATSPRCPNRWWRSTASPRANPRRGHAVGADPARLRPHQQAAAGGQFGALPPRRRRADQHDLARGGGARLRRGAQHRDHRAAVRAPAEQDQRRASCKEEFLRACLAGLFARELATPLRLRELEQSYICAVFHNLGRLLCSSSSRRRARTSAASMQQHDCSEDVAAQRVLGAGFEELGIALARSWGFPD